MNGKVTGRRGSRLAGGGEVVSLTRRPRFTPQKDSWYSCLLEVESTPAPYATGRIRSTEKFNGIIGNRTRDLSEGVNWINLELITYCENKGMDIRVLPEVEDYCG
jgi:hypothetical protein